MWQFFFAPKRGFSVLVLTWNSHFVAKFFIKFLFFLLFYIFFTKKFKKADFNQHLVCKAPRSWSNIQHRPSQSANIYQNDNSALILTGLVSDSKRTFRASNFQKSTFYYFTTMFWSKQAVEWLKFQWSKVKNVIPT